MQGEIARIQEELHKRENQNHEFELFKFLNID